MSGTADAEVIEIRFELMDSVARRLHGSRAGGVAVLLPELATFGGAGTARAGQNTLGLRNALSIESI